MKKFTFIAEYDGGTYISQYLTKDIYAGLIKWAENLPSENFNDKLKGKILNNINDGEEPTQIINVENVWSVMFLDNTPDGYVLVNIILTR